MKRPRFIPVRTAKGWRINVPSALSTSGKRSRLFFPTKEKADGEATRLRGQIAEHGMRTRVLPPAQAEAAERAFKMLGDNAQPEMLLQAAREYVERHNRRLASLPFEQVFSEFAASQKRSDSYARSLRQYKARLAPLHGRLLCDITAGDLNAAMKDFTPTVFNFGLRILGGLFNYGFKLDYCTSNPVKKLDRKKILPKEIQIYTPAEVDALLWSAKPALVPFLAVCMFAGLRASEARKMRWENFDFDEKFLRVPSTVSKTGQPRAIPIEPNLECWLQPHVGQPDELIAPQGENVLRKQLRAVHKAAKVKQIKHGPRHSYASYLLARDGSVDKLLLYVGHEDANTTFRSYASKIATKRAADDFWKIGAPTADQKRRKVSRTPTVA